MFIVPRSILVSRNVIGAGVGSSRTRPREAGKLEPARGRTHFLSLLGKCYRTISVLFVDVLLRHGGQIVK